MRSPGKRPLSFVAEYQFGEDNLLTATYHEERRRKNEARVRNAKSVLKLEGLTVAGDASPTYNMKKLQQEQDRHDEIDQHNLMLLQRLERIHQSLPKQFDVSHHTDAVQTAPRSTNAGLRRRQHDKIEQENQRMQRRLDSVKCTFDLKKLATDAERHDYFSDQLSKIGRRRRAQETLQQLHDLSASRTIAAQDSMRHNPEQFYVYDHQMPRPAAHVAGTRRKDTERHWHNTKDRGNEDEYYEKHRDEPPRQTHVQGKLAPLRTLAARKYVQNHHTTSPTLTSTAKAISAADLLHGFKSF